MGDVRASEIPVARFWSWVDVQGPDDCWPWLGSVQRYGKLRLGDRHIGSHRLAYALEHGVVPADLLVCHHCDNPPCCNPAHLFLGTHADNHADREAKGRGNQKPGTDAIRKLTDAEVMAMRIMAAENPQRGIGRRLAVLFGVSPATVCNVLAGKQWKHVPMVGA